MSLRISEKRTAASGSRRRRRGSQASRPGLAGHDRRGYDREELRAALQAVAVAEEWTERSRYELRAVRERKSSGSGSRARGTRSVRHPTGTAPQTSVPQALRVCKWRCEVAGDSRGFDCLPGERFRKSLAGRVDGGAFAALRGAVPTRGRRSRACRAHHAGQRPALPQFRVPVSMSLPISSFRISPTAPR